MDKAFDLIPVRHLKESRAAVAGAMPDAIGRVALPMPGKYFVHSPKQVVDQAACLALLDRQIARRELASPEAKQ